MAHEFVGAMSYDHFKNDNLRLYGVVRCLEIISEASRRLPGALKERHPSIEWREMAAAGNIYRHEYEDVAARVVWRTLKPVGATRGGRTGVGGYHRLNRHRELENAPYPYLHSRHYMNNGATRKV